MILSRHIEFKEGTKPEKFTSLEWLVTNGLGGFASGTLSGTPMRKHHGLLIAALPSPYGRTMTIPFAEENLILPESQELPLSYVFSNETMNPRNIPLVEFRQELGLPVWRYEINDIILEKRILMVHLQNTVHITYQLLSGPSSLLLKWRPYLQFRGYEQSVNLESSSQSYVVHARDNYYEIEHLAFPRLRFYQDKNAGFILTSDHLPIVYYDIEKNRGYDFLGSMESPGYYLMELELNTPATLVFSTEEWKKIQAVPPQIAPSIENYRRRNLLRKAGSLVSKKVMAELVLSADNFIITPYTRMTDIILMQASGEEASTIIAGYPWFTDWGRDTMISLEGLVLLTGRGKEARTILNTFSHYIKDGLIPNMFPDGENQGLYNTADASLWFFHAIDRYIDLTQDDSILEDLYPKLLGIIQHHIQGTLFGIKVDEDGLLVQGQEGVQLTWMDAKVGDWVVTPRRGKAVELNALWYNALKLMDKWALNKEPLFQKYAEKCYESFNKRFWYESGGYLFDLVDNENSSSDSALRPNQLFAISLRFPVLEPKKWESVLKCVREELLTPFGLRTLSPKHPDYKSCYDGDLRARDAAYHQGTVWPWLIGPYIDVWMKVYPNDAKLARSFLKELLDSLNENCVGSISEIFDAKEPYLARGCFAQAWSVAETIRAFVKTEKLKD
ncbi:amylo-alpha-1,6-glucosidase [Criblamydia sequanensis]|uniref:Glycogen debranching enzyme n=1 Tax=Candidatus Criblamydia sequanensis CRIB-18 TaxID=1437425 RepID=A0A090CZ44_9BACT|nr:amylo-alpha-1,6-glucosidase [Criblamydia sequanensis]CDR33991.1 putative glycogen debranching enzyme [Criblamydia sequanensis CRIB-18]